VLLALAALAATAFAGPAYAAKDKSCAEQIVDDWYDNGRIDFVYPLRCYRDAIKILPPDVKQYSTAKDEIERALADATNRPRVKGPTPIEDVPCKEGKTCTYGSSDGGGGGGGGGGGPNDPGGPAPTGLDDPPAAAPGQDTAGPSSVPVPLIVLGGLALLLLAAGSAGYLARRFGHGGDDEGGEPPAAA
jgi:hypothetical protein